MAKKLWPELSVIAGVNLISLVQDSVPMGVMAAEMLLRRIGAPKRKPVWLNCDVELYQHGKKLLLKNQGD